MLVQALQQNCYCSRQNYLGLIQTSVEMLIFANYTTKKRYF